MVYTDVGGPISPRSREGHRFWLVIVDDFSRCPWVYFMKHKSEALEIYKQWKTDIQTHLRTEIGQEDFSKSYTRFIQSDGGTEYTNKAFRNQLRTNGTILETSAPYTPEQNGLAEQMNQTLATLANSMLEGSKLPKSFWADAMSTAADISVQSLTSTLGGKVPYQVFFNRQVNPTLFRPFGCLAYAHIPKEQWGVSSNHMGRSASC